MSVESSTRFRDWRPGPSGVRYERVDGEGRSTRVVLHPSTPFIAEMAAVETDKLPLADIAHRYLEQLNQHLRTRQEEGLALPRDWLDALKAERSERDDRPLRWLDIWPSQSGSRASRLASWRLIRHIEGARADEEELELDLDDEPHDDAEYADSSESTRDASDETVVMVAAEVLHDSDHRYIATLGFGLRVPIVLSRKSGTLRATIRSMTAELPGLPYRSATEVMALTGKREIFGTIGNLEGLIERLLSSRTDEMLAQRLRLEYLAYDDIRFRWDEDDTTPEFAAVEIHGKGVGVDRSLGRLPYAFTAEFVLPDGGDEFLLIRARRRRLSAAAHPAGTANCFTQEPTSYRKLSGPLPPFEWSKGQVTRSDKELQGFRVPLRIGGQETVSLANKNFRVRNCPQFVRSDPSATAARTVKLPSGSSPSVRSNDFSAISAFVNCRRFFQLIRGAGIPLDSFAVAAKREVQVFYRSGFRPGSGKDGEIINARVWIEPAPTGSSQLPEIQVHLALANLTHRARPVTANANPSKPPAPVSAEPLGIAASDRWMWHEFGHVLLAARFGELEFPFAHSAGDGMAAVIADPFSRLADKRKGVGEHFRGLTYPWVLATRRHDRSVRLGWAWGGTLNRPLLAAPLSQRSKPKGYITEQILSSTLFRLYRVLGGDSVKSDGEPNVALRERASLLTLFLLIQGVRSMAQWPSVAEMLEAAMEDADTGLTQLHFRPFKPRGPLRKDHKDAWVGGRAHKVVRWAFEAQGMFAPYPAVDHNAPGKPPQIDVYIRDQRPPRETTGSGSVQHGPGGYVPVSLDWDGEHRWQAPSSSSGQPVLKIGNRGQTDATGVKLRGWWGIVSGQPDNPGWDLKDRIDWQAAFGDPQPVANADVPAGSESELDIASLATPPSVPAGQFLILLVEASCPDDRANSDPAAMLESAITQPGDLPKKPRHLTDLVANDNNLALWQL